MDGYTTEQTEEELKRLNDWIIADGKLKKKVSFSNFAEALAFANKVGEIAEQENHHPELHVGWGFVHIELYTHSASGLTEKDFSLAEKIDNISNKEKFI
jgi:4a-hydroxytetrahydrobiopterin dehydratase